LDLMGIPYIQAPEEADVICAWLAARQDSDGKPYVKGVCSDDSDMLALGAPYLFKDMLRFMSKDKPVKVVKLENALLKMNLSMDQFTDLCVLLGTDYCDNIKRMGPSGAYKAIIKYGTLEKTLASRHTKLNSESDTSEKINEECMIGAKYYFKNALKKIDESDDFVITDDNLKLRNYQYEELMDFMCIKHDFDITRIQTGINRLKKCYQIMKVTRENTKFVHKILQPRSENYIFKQLSEDNDIEFLSSEDSAEVMPTKKTPPNTLKYTIKQKT
jgi:flap endonuclease-1